MQRSFRFLLLAVLLSPAGAAAATIDNLSDSPQLIEIITGDNARPVSIKAGETWRIPGKLVVRYRSREVHMENDQEYAIWNDGSFGPQRRMRQGAGNLDQ